MSGLLDLHGRALAGFDERVDAIGPDQWHAATPCAEWDVRRLLGHMVAEQLWVPHLLKGETLEDVGDRYDGDQLGDDPVTAWRTAASEARAAWLWPGVLARRVHLSSGLADAGVYCWQMTLDLAVHGWDLARAVGYDEKMDTELAEALYTWAAPQAGAWAGSGSFGEPVPVPEDADAQERLLGLLGRRV
ncbi:TIGR03086 family metal-binding protein [Allonocardiopsis opalescens]|nr:TIGR03086 family metal-binding protein [Allonocardiopsis opalescens]